MRRHLQRQFARQCSTLTPNHVEQLRLLVPGGVLTDPVDTAPFTTDWQGKYVADSNSSVVVLPKTTEQVSDVLRFCNGLGIGVVPQGGNTGLVGGSVPLRDELVLSLKHLNKVIKFDEVSQILTCEAGCVLQDLNDELEEHRCMMPIDLGARGSCTIGGNISTNAGGIQFVRYGSLHGSVLGLEVVLADGRILDLQTPVRKDNTGYDLKQLFIGSEGSLGVVTSVSIQVVDRPCAQNVVLLAMESFEALQHVFRVTAKKHCAEIISAIEYWDSEAMDFALDTLDHLRDPFTERHPFYLLLETSGADGDHDQEKLSRLIDELSETEAILDGCLAQDSAQIEALWGIREGLPVALKHRGGFVYKYDVSLPIPMLNEATKAVRKELDRADQNVKVLQYGHVGDGNLHLNVWSEAYSKSVLEHIEPFLYEYVQAHNGSVSAEHGIGQMKVGALKYSKSPVAIQCMQQLKNTFDPNGIMNPYKVLPSE